MLEHAFGEPVRPALPLEGIAVDGPGLAALFVAQPVRIRRGHVDRMLDGEDEMGAGKERPVPSSHQPPAVLDVADGARAIGQRDYPLRQPELVEVAQRVLTPPTGRYTL